MNTEVIVREFNRIKGLGFIPSSRTHNTGIGKTFEDYLDINENNLQEPDFYGFEVKSHRELASSKITLFTKSPSYPRGANTYLRETYGKPDFEFPDIPVLHTSFFGDRFNTYLGKYGFKIEFDRQTERIYIRIKNLITNSMLDDEIYYTFDAIKKATQKLKYLFVVYAETIYIDGLEHFHFTNAEVYMEFNLEKLHRAIVDGLIQYDIRIGAYKTGKNYGKTHDHGSGFRVHRNNLKDLYTQYINI